MARVVFVESPYIDRECERVQAPFAITKLVNALKKYEDDIEIIDFPRLIRHNGVSLGRNFYEQCARLITRHNPEVVVYASTKFVNFSSTLHIAEKVKNINSTIKNIFGGHQSSLYAKKVIKKFLFIDYIVYGNDIISGCALIEFLLHENQECPSENVYSRANLEPNLKLCNIVSQTRVNIFDSKRFEKDYYDSEAQLELLLEIGNGCGSNCIKCTGCFYEGFQFKYEIELLKNDLLLLNSRGDVRSLYIYDLFLLSDSQILSLCEFITTNKINISWYTRTVANRLSENIIKALKLAGCCEVLVSIEKRNISSFILYNRLDDIFLLAKKYGMEITLCYVIGRDNNENRIRYLINKIHENIGNGFVHYEFSVETMTNKNHKLSEKEKLVLSSIKGIDFMADDQYFDEDLELINANKSIFVNCFSNNRDGEELNYLAKYAIFLLKYYKRSIQMLAKQLNTDAYGTVKYLININKEKCDKKTLMDSLNNAIDYSNVVDFETTLYFLSQGDTPPSCIEYGNKVYIYMTDFDTKDMARETTYYILKKYERNIKIYRIQKDIYDEIYSHHTDISELNGKLKGLLEKQNLL